MDRDLRDRARVGQRDRLPDDPGPRVAALGRQPRLHRPQPVVRALRRRRSPRLPALRSRSGSRSAPTPASSRRRSSSAPACRASACSRSSRPPDRRGCTSTSRSCAGRRRRTSGASPSASRSTSPRCVPTSSPPSTASPSGRRAASSSTTTRTPGDARSRRRTRRGRDRCATVSAPITWDELEAGARIEDFDLRNMPARVAEVGDLWAPLLADTGRFDLAPLLQSIR